LRYNNSSFVTEKNPYTPPFPLVSAWRIIKNLYIYLCSLDADLAQW
jgi:hypothetical protein